MDEKPIATARASVMLFDAITNTWIASGSNPGISKVQLFRHQINNTYRVVGWKLSDKEVVLNCAILRGLKYNQARQTFHQWRDAKHQVYGLNFTNKEEAEQFANAIMEALENLNQIYQQSQDINSQHQVDIQHGNSALKLQQATEPPLIIHSLSSQSQSAISNYQSQVSGTPSMPEYALPQKQVKQITVGSLNNIRDNCSFVTQCSTISNTSNELRTSQEMQKVLQNSSSTAPSQSPSPGPHPPLTAPPLPPGPLPLTSITMVKSQLQQQSTDSDDESSRSGLASQLRQAKLKSRIVVETDSFNQNKTTTTLGRTGGDSMMSEMQRVLAARKKAKEVIKPEDIENNANNINGDSSTKDGQWSQNHYRSQNDFEQINGPICNQLKPVTLDTVKSSTIQSATLGRKMSLKPDTQQLYTNLTRQDLDNFKIEIIQEVRGMILQFKADIINVIRSSKS